MIRRRQTLIAAAGALAGGTTLAAPKPLPFQPLAAPEPIAQIGAGGPMGLLAVGVSGALLSWPTIAASPRRLGGDLDPATPLAFGHGRIAARRRDGALWVLEGGRGSASAPGTLAPAAGLLVLPLAVIAVAAGAEHHVLRLEPSASGSWRTAARSAVAAMPDARPLQADLDGSGDAGHVIVLAGADSQRYAHGVLGDAIEATRVVLLERHSLRVMRELVLDAPYVFEDIAPRKVAAGPREALLTVQSGPLGAQLVLVDADPAASASLRIAARGPALGMANRWLSPMTDGRRLLAVHTPHIGGVLHEYLQEGSRLRADRLLGDVSNHRIGSRQLDMSAWQGGRLLIPDQSGQRLLLLDAASGWRLAGEHRLASRVKSMVGLGESGRVAVLMDDGSVSTGSVAG